jgi:hypothetical protein
VFQNPDVPSRRLRRLTISGVSSGSPADPEHPITPCGPFNFSFLEAFGVPLCRLKAGETLFRTGEEGKPMFLVVEGQIEVQIAGKPVAAGMHGIVGEMALIDKAPRKLKHPSRSRKLRSFLDN